MIKSIAKQALKSFFKAQDIFNIPLGKNRGLKLKYFDELNLDMVLGMHEPNTFEVMHQLIKPGMLIADIGANIGYFTRYLSKKTGPSGHVYAFEPIPDTYTRMVQTIDLNKLTNVTPVQLAVTDKHGTIEIFLSKNHYMASIDENWASKEGGSLVVETTSIDKYFSDLGRYPDLIKMDIEGGGFSALEGMKTCIAENAPILILESHTKNEDLAIGKALSSIIEYEVYRVGDSTPIKYLDAAFDNEYGVYGTVVGIPKRRISEFPLLDPKKFQTNKLGQRKNKH